VRLLAAVADAGVSLRELVAGVPRLPQVLVNVRGVDHRALDAAESLWGEVKRAEADLGDAGRVLLRASGTEPVVRVMVEADREDRARAIADELAEVVRRELPAA
jgi:phosphoglucosamine mutase